jgi:hypothetical protein
MSDRSKRPTLRQTPDPDGPTKVWDHAPKPDSGPQPQPQQLRAISKKTPGVSASDTPERALPVVKLRAMSEVQSGPIVAPQSLGYLAPPRDPADVRARRRRDLVMWSSVCVMIACAIALGIWFMAR